MLSIHCKKCNQLFGESFYFYFTNSSQLACKEVTIDNVLNKLTSNKNNEYKCIQCGSLVCKKQDLLLFQYNTIYFKEQIHGNLYIDTIHYILKIFIINFLNLYFKAKRLFRIII
jgi:hypothetical protein